jgi:DNA-binding NarL/FixJ family response regulator
MGLVGSLEDLSLLDILQIVNVSKRTGILSLKPGEGPAYCVFFNNGKIKEIVGGFDETSFLDLFEQQGVIDTEEKADVMIKSGGDIRQAIQIMFDQNYINEKLLEQARRQELGRRLKFLTTISKTGEFAFFLGDDEIREANLPDTFLPLETTISPQGLLTQGFIDESSASLKFEFPPQPIQAAKEKEAEKPLEHHEEIEELGEEDVEVVPHDIPVQKDTAGAPAVDDFPRLSPAMPRINPAKSSLTIILAADESIFKNMLWQTLVDHFSYVERISSLPDYIRLAQTLLEKKRPFIVLVDLLMPTSDGKGYTGGLEILDESRSLFPEVKIILLSDLVDPRMDDIAISKGALCVVRKPELARLQLGQIEDAIGEFADSLSRTIDELFPPQEEELTTFFRDLGAEPTPAGMRVRDQLSLLKGLLGELANPKESSEISLLVLRLAAEYFERAILLLVKKTEMIGLGGFGITGDQEPMSHKVARLRVPTNVDASWKRVIDERATAITQIKDATAIDHNFCDAIGTHTPTDFALIPMVSRGRVIALLYADNAVSQEAIPELSAIEIFMTQAGLAMERALLERQLLSFRKGLKQREEPSSE